MKGLTALMGLLMGLPLPSIADSRPCDLCVARPASRFLVLPGNAPALRRVARGH